MSIVYDTCREYASSFSERSMNLLFQGGTGLGKTFLSACIARVVAQNGHSVCYDTAASALEAFEMKIRARRRGCGKGLDTGRAHARVRAYDP